MTLTSIRFIVYFISKKDLGLFNSQSIFYPIIFPENKSKVILETFSKEMLYISASI